jgi:hypothetical protein
MGVADTTQDMCPASYKSWLWTIRCQGCGRSRRKDLFPRFYIIYAAVYEPHAGSGILTIYAKRTLLIAQIFHGDLLGMGVPGILRYPL